MKKKLFSICALALISVLCIVLAACNPNDENQPSEAVSFVSLDINPSIELTLDKNNKVVSVYGANEDGQVLLYGETSIVGTDIESAVNKITSLAIELGYISEDNVVIQTSATADGNTEELLNKINAQINATADSLNVSVKVSGADAYSLLRKLEEVKKQYPDNEAIQSLTPEQFKLVVSASEAGDITIEAAVELDTEQLIKAVSESHKKAEEFATLAYDKATTLAKDAYDKAVGAAMDGIYTSYYMTHHPLSAYNGFAYQGYKTTARGLYAIADALDFVEDMYEYPLDDAQISAAAEALGLGNNVEPLKNSDGEVTVESIYAYADKVFKNSELSQDLDNMKKQLSDVLDSVENDVQVKIKEIAQQYSSEIEVIKTSLTSVIDGIKGLESLIPEAFMTQIEAVKTDLNEILTDLSEIVSDRKISSDEIRALADKLNKKSGDALEKIENDLTEEELAEIAELQQAAADNLANAKAELDDKLAKAEEAAKDYLKQLKEERQTNK